MDRRADRLLLCMLLATALMSQQSNLAWGAGSDSAQQREATLIEAAKKEGKVVWWNPSPAKEVEQVLAKFRERHPYLKTEYWRSSDVHQKLLSEARAGTYNVDVFGIDIESFQEIKKAGLIKKYDWPSTRSWPPGHRDPEGYWVTRLRSIKLIAYNTDLVSKAEAPKSWDDVLDPKWKGAIHLDKNSADWVLMLWGAWGKDKTINYLQKISKNSPVLGPNQTARVELLAAGAVKIDMHASVHVLLRYQDRGAPLDFVRTNPILEKSTPMFIADHAPHPNAAMLFADWFTSLEGQQAYYDATLSPVPHPGVKGRVAEAIKGLNVAVFPPEMTVHGNEASKIFRDIFWK